MMMEPERCVVDREGQGVGHWHSTIFNHAINRMRPAHPARHTGRCDQPVSAPSLAGSASLANLASTPRV